jgi:imidazolonepropionase-like amidohydrolase
VPAPGPPKLSGIKAALLIPGRGEPIKHGAVVLHEDKITWVGPQSALPLKYSALAFTEVPVLMPGLWDCHVHFFGAGSDSGGSGYDAILITPAALAGARVATDLRRTLMAGFTSVREVGGYAGEIFPAVLEGSIVGPNVYSAIAPISMTGGHGDIHNLPLQTVMDANAHGLPMAVCDGVPECIKTVRKMIRRGAKCIKVCSSGGVMSILDDPQDAEFSPEELKAMVDEASRAKRSVAAHCHGKQGIINALNAGVKTIEHGSYMDEECVELMKEKDAIYVATALVIEEFMKDLNQLPPIQRKKLQQTAAHSRYAYSLAIRHGVKIALGTDQADSDENSWNSHGRNGKEIYYAVKAGMTPLQAIEACTATSPETLGKMAPKSGQLKEGYDADLIALLHNPLDDIELLSSGDNVTHVWKGGKLFKSPKD